FIRSKKRASRARSASGSVCSPSEVDPATSQKTTVTVFRTSCPAPEAGSPHSGQNLNDVSASKPQDAHAVIPRSLERSKNSFQSDALSLGGAGWGEARTQGAFVSGGYGATEDAASHQPARRGGSRLHSETSSLKMGTAAVVVTADDDPDRLGG